MTGSEPRPRYDTATLEWSAEMVRTWLKRRRLRLAAEQAAEPPEPDEDDAGGGDGPDAA